jgi:hypothetical protein
MQGNDPYNPAPIDLQEVEWFAIVYCDTGALVLLTQSWAEALTAWTEGTFMGTSYYDKDEATAMAREYQERYAEALSHSIKEREYREALGRLLARKRRVA